MQMTREGKETVEIRAFIDEKYSQYGPPTDTEPVPESQFGMAGPPLPGSTSPLPANTVQEGTADSCGQTASSCQETGR